MNRITILLSCIATASGQSTVSPSASFAHAANAGWIDFRAGAGDGVRLTETFLSGKAYAANLGWIDCGDGSPSNGHSYSNATTGDFGVNLAADGTLSGAAYAANLGWISFEQTHGKPKLNLLTGHAHAANAGWIALDTAFSDLATLFIARPDTDEPLFREWRSDRAQKTGDHWTSSEVGAADNLAESSSLAFGPGGQAAIAYRDLDSGTLKFAVRAPFGAR